MIMYELRKIFQARVHHKLMTLGLGPIGEKLIMAAFDEAVKEAEENHRHELARAGLIRAA